MGLELNCHRCVLRLLPSGLPRGERSPSPDYYEQSKDWDSNRAPVGIAFSAVAMSPCRSEDSTRGKHRIRGNRRLGKDLGELAHGLLKDRGILSQGVPKMS